MARSVPLVILLLASAPAMAQESAAKTPSKIHPTARQRSAELREKLKSLK